MSGVVPQVAALMGPCAAGTAYIPGLADFVPMVSGQGLDGARRAAPRARGDRRGRHARRSSAARGCTAASRASATSSAPTTRSASRSSSEYLSFFPSHCEQPPPVVAAARPGRPDGGRAAGRPAGVQPQALRHVRRDPADRRRRRVARPQAQVGAGRSSPAWPGWAAGPSASSPPSRATSAASSTTTRPTRRRAS